MMGNDVENNEGPRAQHEGRGEEREERESKEEELINVLKGVAGKVQDALQKTKIQRFFFIENLSGV